MTLCVSVCVCVCVCVCVEYMRMWQQVCWRQLRHLNWGVPFLMCVCVHASRRHVVVKVCLHEGVWCECVLTVNGGGTFNVEPVCLLLLRHWSTWQAAPHLRLQLQSSSVDSGLWDQHRGQMCAAAWGMLGSVSLVSSLWGLLLSGPSSCRGPGAAGDRLWVRVGWGSSFCFSLW